MTSLPFPALPYRSGRRAAVRGRPYEQGLSLVELMVSLSIGLVVVGAVFANYLNNSAGARQAAAMAQVTQDASLAMGILRNHIAMAGYSRPVGVAGGAITHAVTGLQAIVGCTEGFTSATDNNADYGTISCNAASPANTPPQPDSLAVSYEADTSSTPLNATAVPTDCAGDGLVQTPGTNTYFVADNRFAIRPATAGAPPSLVCLGNGGVPWGSALQSVDPTSGSSTNKGYQPLVENIADMRIRYGIAGATNKNVTQYLTSTDIRNNGVDWARVISVRICLLVQSNDNVLDKPRPYYNCDGGVSTPATGDRHIYRAFNSTVVLNNRIAS